VEPSHSLLIRQLKRHIGSFASIPEEWQVFIDAVDKAYRQFDEDRTMLERSLDLSSQELLQSNSDMKVVFERLINSSVDGILAFDRDCRFTVWNPGMERITGIRKEEANGKNASGIFLSLKDADEAQFLREVLQGKTVVAKNRAYVARGTGHQGFFEGYYSPLLNETGEIIGGLAIIRDVTEQKEWEERLKHSVNYDPLTDLPNRNLFTDRLTQALARAPWSKRRVGILFLDLNRFKVINDTLGHEVGDLLLKNVAARLVTCIRTGDTVAHFGGDKFAILLEDLAQADDIPKVLQKVLAFFSESFLIEGHELFTTPSIGVSVYPNDGRDVESLLKCSNTALLRAKEQGSPYQFYLPTMNVKASQRLALESGLRHALERQEFLLHYQPKVAIKTGRIVGMEALVRWRHPEKGIVPPAEFISLAEETGLIIPIGEWVLRTACIQTKTWQTAGMAPIRVAVNLSARQLQNQNLVEIVEQALSETGLEPNFLELELTESVLMQNLEANSVSLDKLHRMGVEIAIDDFGTGYSSLAYLKRFPISSLKIDRSFVRS
jgi:diguanylate cyclase (GGDEF)-like protein/PAS domain S-box-containing protein